MVTVQEQAARTRAVVLERLGRPVPANLAELAKRAGWEPRKVTDWLGSPLETD